ncbi:hypothetical protein DFJ58DRAFT_723944 [Suillus subalutaceus]|uniref:uncharacterized protein n=1 Tax=Suillus subalutaceus TaxID=48586 RepID=UPI001B88079D|nr:uncharacterized protein DFJ58DRAFT_723944 [Suillus subalutaceus]KAG1867269.1 hypothetical protein DFJ58DRAFT_723944 [Suillus subalutaceus]
MDFFSSVSRLFFDLGILSWDVLLTLSNLVRRSRRIRHVTPEGHPGYGGYWPEYRPPKETDSRCSCPALNAMANHGKATARITFDLEELDLHSGIEHDASLLCLNAAFQPDQSIKHVPFIEELLAAATGKDKDGNDLITTKDLSRMLGKRRAVARAVTRSSRTASSTRSLGARITVFGGRVDDLRSFLLHERIPESWESRIRQPYGLTLMTFNKTILGVEFGVCEQDWAEAAREAVERHTAPT